MLSVGGEVDLNANPAFLDLDGLSSVGGTIGGIDLQGNENLEDVLGLAGVMSVDGDVRISGNEALPSSNADALVGNIGKGNITGTIEIEDNAP